MNTMFFENEMKKIQNMKWDNRTPKSESKRKDLKIIDSVNKKDKEE